MALDVHNAGLDESRLARLIEVGRSLLSELRLEPVLQRVLETACEITGARYAAVGVLDERRTELARFVTRGIDPETHRAIGDLPRGRGVLGVLIEEPKPLRLHDVTSDPRSYGFPLGHPPMHTFLGVPIRIREQAWGNLYLCEKEGGDFNEADEASVVVLADWAAIAIENARLYGALDERRTELERAVRGFEATAAIAQAVGGETDLDRVLELVVKRARALVEARSVLVLLRDGDHMAVVAGAGQVSGAEGRLPIAGTTIGAALERLAPLQVDDVDGDPDMREEVLGVPDASAALLVPLVYRGRGLGVLVAFDRLADPAAFGEDDLRALRAFAASAATAVATAKTVEEVRVRQTLAAAEAERKRWARELHDETLQNLGALKVLLSGAARSDDPARMKDGIQDALAEVTGGIENLRAIITELRPASLDALGLVPALEALAQRLASVEGLDVAVDLSMPREDRLDEELETTLYRVAQEALTNVAKHARAEHVSLSLGEHDGRIVLTVEDDGVGFDPEQPGAGFGLVGIRERAALGGAMLEIARLDPGTRVRASFPAARTAGA